MVVKKLLIEVLATMELEKALCQELYKLMQVAPTV